MSLRDAIEITPPESCEPAERFTEFPDGVALDPIDCPCCRVNPAMFFVKARGVFFRICPACVRVFFPSQRMGCIKH